MTLILAIDQGTTGTTCLAVDDELNVVGRGYAALRQHFPQPGWVEHDPHEIWASVQQAMQGLDGYDAIAITNQRETTVVWDRKTGEPVAPAIVWQDRRTSEYMLSLREAGKEPFIQQKTGLLFDPYFSASKLHWLLRQIPNARARAEAGELAAGTIDSWLILNPAGAGKHLPDVTIACRTMLINTHTGDGDSEPPALFDVPAAILPRIAPSSGDLGVCDHALFGA